MGFQHFLEDPRLRVKGLEFKALEPKISDWKYGPLIWVFRVFGRIIRAKRGACFGGYSGPILGAHTLDLITSITLNLKPKHHKSYPTTLNLVARVSPTCAGSPARLCARRTLEALQLGLFGEFPILRVQG